MKSLFFAFLLLIGFTHGLAQDRWLAPVRTFEPLPQLAVFNGTEYATGIAQTPDLQVLVLSDLGWPPIPAGSTVGIYGSYLTNNSVSQVWLRVVGWQVTVEVDVYKLNIPGLEMAVFHLPAEVHGEVWITTVGRRSSNSVRLTVE